MAVKFWLLQDVDGRNFFYSPIFVRSYKSAFSSVERSGRKEGRKEKQIKANKLSCLLLVITLKSSFDFKNFTNELNFWEFWRKLALGDFRELPFASVSKRVLSYGNSFYSHVNEPKFASSRCVFIVFQLVSVLLFLPSSCTFLLVLVNNISSGIKRSR